MKGSFQDDEHQCRYRESLQKLKLNKNKKWELGTFFILIIIFKVDKIVREVTTRLSIGKFGSTCVDLGHQDSI